LKKPAKSATVAFHAGDTWVNMEMMKSGAAWVYMEKPDQFWADLNEAEGDARNPQCI